MPVNISLKLEDREFVSKRNINLSPVEVKIPTTEETENICMSILGSNAAIFIDDEDMTLKESGGSRVGAKVDVSNKSLVEHGGIDYASLWVSTYNDLVKMFTVNYLSRMGDLVYEPNIPFDLGMFLNSIKPRFDAESTTTLSTLYCSKERGCNEVDVMETTKLLQWQQSVGDDSNADKEVDDCSNVEKELDIDFDKEVEDYSNVEKGVDIGSDVDEDVCGDSVVEKEVDSDSDVDKVVDDGYGELFKEKGLEDSDKLQMCDDYVVPIPMPWTKEGNSGFAVDGIHDDIVDCRPIASLLPSSYDYDNREQTGDGNHVEFHYVEPALGMVYNSAEDAHRHYISYAANTGFVCRVGQLHRSRLDGSISSRKFVCSREGFQISSRCGCNAFIRVTKDCDSGKWVTSNFVKEHNHSLDGSGKLKRKLGDVNVGSSSGGNKRARGRPRVKKDNNDCKTLNNSVKKPRGRPRLRTADEGLHDQKNGSSKKDRGRSKKAVKRGPGRPRLNSGESSIKVTQTDGRENDGDGVRCDGNGNEEMSCKTQRIYVTRSILSKRRKVRLDLMKKLNESGMTGEDPDHAIVMG